MEYHKPGSFEEATTIANGNNGVTRFLAGGTDVLVQLRSDILTPDILIDMKHIEGVKDISHDEDGWHIGIAVSGAEMSEHLILKKEWPGIVEAMDLIGSTQVQGRATLVGNLCNGSPAADGVPSLIAARAQVSVTGTNGTRRVNVEDIPIGPGKTSLLKGEVVSALHLPKIKSNQADAYLRFIPRTEMDIAVVGCAINIQTENDIIIDARISLGAVAPTALLLEKAAKKIIGTKLDDIALSQLSQEASNACQPIDDKRGTIKFRTHIAGVLAKRTAKIAYDRARLAK
ncbi:MAG: xanthine dehydrogenase family protein subunit M [Rhodobacteraceae bacterium]|nr:xanthine dehydrogenase family protein subunit M [Paracoccaceae bacterium]